MKKQSRNFLYALVLIASVVATTACNRGYGCPTDFSLEVEQPSNLDQGSSVYMAEFKNLDSIEGVDLAIKASFARPVVIFKHSTTCPISSMAKSRVDRAYEGEEISFDYYHLDLLRHREVSNYIAKKLAVRHQSPQAIVVSDGEAIHNASHLDINPAEIAGLSIQTVEGHRIFETQDGSRSLFSERFGVSYHSKYGAWQETQHVFIEAGLRYQSIDKQQISFLDIGFGTGLNGIASLLFAFQQNMSLEYVGLEAFPVPQETLNALDYPSLLEWSSEEIDLYNQMHAQAWDGKTYALQTDKEAISLNITKRKQKFEDLIDVGSFDVIYYDAFAPEAQPELWTIEMFERMYRALKPEGILVTYCAKGQVKRDMKTVGFTVERLKGPPGKREMTRATKA